MIHLPCALSSHKSSYLGCNDIELLIRIVLNWTMIIGERAERARHSQW